MIRFQCGILAFVILVLTTAAAASAVTVSGTVTYQGSPVQGVPVYIMSKESGEMPTQLTTDAQGNFSVQITGGGFVEVLVKPDASTGYAEVMKGLDGLDKDVHLDIQLVQGHLFSGMVLKPDGSPHTEKGAALELYAMSVSGDNTEYQCRIDSGTGAFEKVLPQDIFLLNAFYDKDSQFHAPRTRVDLRTQDVAGYVVQLVDEPVFPIPLDPPNAEAISFGSVNDLGVAQVTGAAGAVEPLSHVLLVNQKAAVMSHTVSEADGSFSGSVFAPPGSPILIKYGPPGNRWMDLDIGVEEFLNPYPGTIIHVPYETSAKKGKTPFATVGGIGLVDTDPGAPKKQKAVWSLSGEMSTVALSPGDKLELNGQFTLYSPLIDASTDLESGVPRPHMHLLKLFDAQGRPYSREQQWVTTRQTPTGFPIQSETLSNVDVDEVTAELSNYANNGGRNITADFSAECTVPSDTQEGVYMAIVMFVFDDVPAVLGEGDGFLGAVVGFNGHGTMEAYTAPITVGNPEQPKLIMQMFMNEYTQGLHGVVAKEDREHYQFSQQITFQGEPYWLEPVNLRNGKAKTFRLEPYLPMISFTDRRSASPPLIPFAFPSGLISMQLTMPDGAVKDFEPAVFIQSFNRTPTTDAGLDLNSGTVQYDDVYSLKTDSEEFTTGFDQYGKYTAKMDAEVEDIWGNTYTGGGTYEFYAARTLDIDPGVLPGTGFEVGDAFNPTLRLYPRVPASVNWTITHYPYSDRSLVRKQTIFGTAGKYGFFDSSEAFVFNAPGEYRVDLQAQYRDGNGALYMGSMTWGGVVETPNPALIAHGRRGADAIDDIPDRPWYFLCRDLTVTGVSHTFNPYFNGDILWTRMPTEEEDECGGDSLTLVARVFDRTGKYQPLLEQYKESEGPSVSNPGTFEEQVAVGEIPLYSVTAGDLTPHLVKEEDLLIAGYYYLSSQRPGIRVREYAADSIGEFSSYWRLDTLYDHQLGVGTRGDQPNDYKFQYVGTVFRDIQGNDQQYSIQGTLWVFTPPEQAGLSRAMPPFAGQGNGGWSTDGGPIMTIKDEDIHIFMYPTGVQPGEVLSLGDRFSFACHAAPTLNSRIALRVIAPSGKTRVIHGRANKIGYYADPWAAFSVDEPGLWTVEARILHDGECSGGLTVPPYPQGSVLGADQGRFSFYVPSAGTERLVVTEPQSGVLSYPAEGKEVALEISGPVPAGLSNPVLQYTVMMPGCILAQGREQVSGGTYSITFNATELQEYFPNLDTMNKEGFEKPGLVDTISFGMLLSGTSGGETRHYANTLTAQGDQLYIGGVDFP